MKMTTLWGLLVVACVSMGCRANDSASEADALATGSEASPSAETKGSAGVRTGTIEIDGEIWTIVPAVQCSVYPGPVAYVAGHADKDDTVEITLDYNPGDRLVGATVENSDGTLAWVAMDEQVRFEVDGDHIKGEGRFTWQGAGAAREAPGKFDVRCR